MARQHRHAVRRPARPGRPAHRQQDRPGGEPPDEDGRQRRDPGRRHAPALRWRQGSCESLAQNPCKDFGAGRMASARISRPAPAASCAGTSFALHRDRQQRQERRPRPGASPTSAAACRRSRRASRRRDLRGWRRSIRFSVGTQRGWSMSSVDREHLARDLGGLAEHLLPVPGRIDAERLVEGGALVVAHPHRREDRGQEELDPERFDARTCFGSVCISRAKASPWLNSSLHHSRNHLKIGWNRFSGCASRWR